MKKIALKFTKTHGPYAQGERAGFSEDKAKIFVDAGLCERCEAPENKEVATPDHNKMVSEPISCKGVTSKGESCARKVDEGEEFCFQHCDKEDE